MTAEVMPQPRPIQYPDLPICAHRAALIKAIQAHPVLIVCGATGSGKTTQLPKLCLEAGRGQRAMIGHTQPRRLAARAVAGRIATELATRLGSEVGYKIRFTDETAAATRIKLMTDGILLAEIASDPLLRAYDTLIIDEAHERSLNMDFLLGYLHRILPRRPDLRVLITSATLEPARFAEHFSGAPVFNVEGRSYPVAIEYLPAEPDEDLAEHVARAVALVASKTLGSPSSGTLRDVLVFLPGERQIREAQRVLERRRLGFHVLPLFGRLPGSQQLKIFEPGRRPRIVLATNIAETSLTVPRIGFVIDAGLARVSRYSPRTRFQGLPVEPIAQANAQQRAGRCGRLAPGLCVRLYDEADFRARPAFAEPEILRTNLASVILRLEGLGLGHMDDFPFLDQPSARAVRDGYRLLELLGALDAEHKLTAVGRTMARLPLEPRLARVLMAAATQDVLSEALVIVAALSVQDPRERPVQHRQQADESHAQWHERQSDFMTLLKLWQDFRRHARGLSRSAFKRWCRENFLSPARLREWEDVHGQLRAMARDLRLAPLHAFKNEYAALHRALVTGFVDQVAQRGDKNSYVGAHQSECWVFPGSALQGRSPRWIIAAERVVTSRPYLHQVARIAPEWVADAAPHLVSTRYLEPTWDTRRGRVLARELKSIFGLTLGAGRRVNYGDVDRPAARMLFLDQALVRGELGRKAAFLSHNLQLRDQVLAMEARIRSRRLLVGDRALAQFYAERLPSWVCDRPSLFRWLKKHGRRGQRRLSMRLEDVCTGAVRRLDEDYPLHLQVAGQALPLRYTFDPGRSDDGITLRVPRLLLPALRPGDLDWLVPGWLAEKLTVLIKALPKPVRRQLVPVPDTVATLPAALKPLRDQPLFAALARVLETEHGLSLGSTQLSAVPLPEYLQMNVEVIDAEGVIIGRGRNLAALQAELKGGPAVEPRPRASAWRRRNLTGWDFGDLPERVAEASHGTVLQLYPALIERDRKADLTLLSPGPAANAAHRAGVRRLMLKSLPQQCGLINDTMHGDRVLKLSYFGIGSEAELLDDILRAAADDAFALAAGEPVRTGAAFAARLESGRAKLVASAEALLRLVYPMLERHREIRDRLDAGSRLPDNARVDIQQQLSQLVYPGFLTATPPQWRRHLSRYLRAIVVRLDKLATGHPKDAVHQGYVADAAAPLKCWVEQWPADRPWPTAMIEYRWHLEELRVSLFAQSLGTSVRVSGKRLEERWAAARDTAA
jgi:ATP-dependent helicase HrpA